MAIQITSAPTARATAYRPMRWEFSSTLYPNQEPTEKGVILNITYPSAFEQGLYPNLDEFDVRIQHQALQNIDVGQWVRVEGMSNNLYQPYTDPDTQQRYGLWRVKKVITQQYLVIDAPYNGDDGNGTVEKYYRNYKIRIRIYKDGQLLPIDDILVEPRGSYHSATFSDDLQDSFRHILGPPTDTLDDSSATYSTVDWSISGAGKSHESYYITYAEVFDVPNSSGINVPYEGAQYRDLFRTVINAIKPMFYFQNRTLDRNWTENFDDYFLISNPVVDLPTRFMTNAPTTQTIGRDEFAQLLTLTDRSRQRIQIKTYPEKDLGGTLIGTTNVGSKTMDVTNLLYVGTKHMGSIITAATKSYSVEVQSGSGTQLSQTRTYNIDDNCYYGSVRFFWLNQLGGIDSFTFTGHESETYATDKMVYKQREGTGFDTDISNRQMAHWVNYQTEISVDKTIGARVDNETAQWLRELMWSNYVWIVDSALDEFIPVVIGDMTATYYDSKRTNQLVMVEYSIAQEYQVQV
jgi:hypothetical protein